MTTQPTETTPSAIWPLMLLTSSRAIMDTALRSLLAFLPIFARGLNVSEGQLQRIISLSYLVGLILPFFAILSEKIGRKRAILSTQLIFILGCVLGFGWTTALGFGVAYFAVSLGQGLLGPNIWAYISDIVPYHQRGRALAVVEFAWAGALLLGAPFIGWVLQEQSWNTSFLWLGLFSLVTLCLVQFTLPALPVIPSASALNWRDFGRLLRLRPVWGLGGFIFTLLLGNQLISITMAGWIERRFSVAILALSATAMIIGLAELLGEVGGTVWTDRIGKERLAMLMAMLAALSYLLLPLIGKTLFTAQLMMFITYFTFEMAFVAYLPIVSEVLPHARTLAMTLLGLLGLLGRFLGGFLAEPLQNWGGFTGLCVVAALITVGGVIIFLQFLRPHPHSPA